MLKNIIVVADSPLVMSNVGDTRLKGWVAAFWKGGRLTP